MSLIKEEYLKNEVKKAVLNAVGPVHKILRIVIQPFSKSRLGMIADHHSITVDLDFGLRLNFFAKTTSKQNDFTDHEWYLKEELEFLRDVLPQLSQEEKWCPRCYLAKPEIFIFEDLKSEGYAIRPSGIFDKRYLTSALTTLARFHAASINLEKSLGRSLDQEFPGRFREKIFTDSGKAGQANKLGFETMALLARDFEMDGDLMPRILERLYEVVKSKPGKLNVICHGDLWRTNIMFDDSAHCLLVDFQMLRYCSPTVDLAMLVHTRSDPEFPAPEAELVKHYYETLKESAEDLPDWDEFWSEYEESRLVGLAYAAMAWPKGVFTEFMNDPDKLAKWYTVERYSSYKLAMEEDKAYERMLKMRLSGLLREARRVLG